MRARGIKQEVAGGRKYAAKSLGTVRSLVSAAQLLSRSRAFPTKTGATDHQGKRAAWRKRAGRQPANLKGRLAAELT